MINKQTRVLLVEDHAIAMKVGVMVLKQLHCTVDTALTGAQALKQIAENDYDLIFVDLGLPDTDGFTLTETIRNTKGQNAFIPIIALTAHSDEDYQAQSSGAGMNGYVVKPLTMESCEKILKTYAQAE